MGAAFCLCLQKCQNPFDCGVLLLSPFLLLLSRLISFPLPAAFLTQL